MPKKENGLIVKALDIKDGAFKAGYPLIILFCLIGILTDLFAQNHMSDSDENAPPLAHLLIDRFLATHHYFENPTDVYKNYTLHLGLEALVNYQKITKDTTYSTYIHRYFTLRSYRFSDTISYRIIPFSDPYYAYFSIYRDNDFLQPFLFQATSMRNEVPLTREGAICLATKSDTAMLIDYLQDYGSRMARAGKLSGDTSFFGACVRQFEFYHDILRYPASGLYSQGRGWLPDKSKLSPGCWSRGQGWLLRGMVESIVCIPPESKYYQKLAALLSEFSRALLKAQQPSGMWHTLPCLPFEESHPEVSGTAMIIYYLSKASQLGHINISSLAEKLAKARMALQHYIDREGNITNISPGPGPLREQDPYRQPGEQNNPHGFPFVLMALTCYLGK